MSAASAPPTRRGAASWRALPGRHAERARCDCPAALIFRRAFVMLAMPFLALAPPRPSASPIGSTSERHIRSLRWSHGQGSALSASDVQVLTGLLPTSSAFSETARLMRTVRGKDARGLARGLIPNATSLIGGCRSELPRRQAGSSPTRTPAPALIRNASAKRSRPGRGRPGVAPAGSVYGAVISGRFCVDQDLNIDLGPKSESGPGFDMDHTIRARADAPSPTNLSISH